MYKIIRFHFCNNYQPHTQEGKNINNVKTLLFSEYFCIGKDRLSMD